MQRALELAAFGRGRVSPNPMVGCVIVYQDKIIGEGWHQQYGGPHAEVNAVNTVEDQDLLRESTIYVSLEPCSHFGKTPPCADLLIEKQVKKVIVCNVDLNPWVAGKGIEKLGKAGIEVQSGILEQEGLELNRRFFTNIEKKRPYIILKWAETADGFIAREDFDSKWISNALSRKLVHKWRAEEDAVLVGTNTVHYDDPRLNVRDWQGKNPLRLFIDRNLRLSHTLHVFDKSQPTICYNLLKAEEQDGFCYVKLNNENFLGQMMQDLYKRTVQSVMVEGGAYLLNELIRQGFWDEARIFKSDVTFLQGIQAPAHPGKLISIEPILNDRLLVYQKY